MEEKIDFKYSWYLEFVETDKVFVGMRPDGILHIFFKSNLVVDQPMQNWLLIVYNHLTKGEASPAVLEGGEFVRITKESTRYIEQYEDDVPLISNAVIVKNQAQFITAKFFLKFMKVSIPMKIFKRESDAIAWSLEQKNFLEKNQSSKKMVS